MKPRIDQKFYKFECSSKLSILWKFIYVDDVTHGDTQYNHSKQS